MGFHRGRIRIDPAGDYSQHIDDIPAGAECLGVVQVGTAKPGALIHVLATGEYWQVDRENTTKLLTRKVIAALDSLGSQTDQGQRNGPGGVKNGV